MVWGGGRRFYVGVGGISGVADGRTKGIVVLSGYREYAAESYCVCFGLMVGGEVWGLEMGGDGCSFEGQTILAGPGASVPSSS